MTTAINLIIDTSTRINIKRGWETANQRRNRALWLDHLYNWQVFMLFGAISPANDTIDQRAYRQIEKLEQGGFFYDD